MSEKREKLKGIQRIIANKMVKSMSTIPHVTTIREVRMEKVLEKMQDLNEKINERVTFMPFIVKAVVKGIKKHLIINASLQDDEIIYQENINIGIAVEVDNKLLVPIIKEVQNKNFLEIVQAINAITEKSRNNQLNPGDFKNGTFTISNSGALGGEIFTPIINYPQSAILGIGRVVKKAIVDKNGEIKVCSMMYLCLSYDHRIINGGEAVRFLGEIDDYLQKPILDV